MKLFLITGLGLVVLIPILLIFLLRGRRKLGKDVYQKNSLLFSPEERSFHGVLRQAVGDEFEIFGKIRVGDIIQPRRGIWDRNGGGKELAARHFPFVLCHRHDLSIACVVQLQDRGLGSRKAAGPDGLLKAVCDAAGLPLVSIGTSPYYQAEEIRATIREALREQPLMLPQTDGRKEPSISNMDGLDLG